MDFITNLLVAQPTGFWHDIIAFFASFISNYALVIIVLTLCIKLILTPLDFLNKKVTRDSSRMQVILGPQFQKLEKQYAKDPQKLNQKKQELYKSSGFNVMGSCVIMLLNIVLTLVVFITLFTALQTTSGYKIEQQYLHLKQSYDTAYTEVYNGTNDAAAKTAAQNAVLEKYDENNYSFLWIKNVWVPDNPWTSAILPFDSYIVSIGNDVKTSLESEAVKFNEMTDTQKEEFKAEYNAVVKVLFDERGGVNGFLLTTVLAVLTAFLSQYLMQRRTQNKNLPVKQGAGEPPATPQTGKIMLIILPIIMGIITMFYNAIFGLYIISSQLVSLATFPLIDKLLNKYYDKKDKERAQKIKADYSRK
ncbi:MAG: membrane protein insertase YidC [Clostridia bacterium]|jgi:YidC/Oxa1 family membrane protein insertase|nr:membrane protein insertase YidC [Clostridia bacterium]